MQQGRLVIFCDLDDIWADFCGAWHKIAKNLGMEDIPAYKAADRHTHTKWMLEDQYAMRKEDIKRLYWEIADTEEFWAQLGLVPSVTLYDIHTIHRISEKHILYFVTARFPVVGRSTYHQTVYWINTRMLPFGPGSHNLVVTHKKRELAEILEPDVAIDDHPGYLKDYVDLGMKVFAPRAVFTDVPGVDRTGLQGFLDFCMDF